MTLFIIFGSITAIIMCFALFRHKERMEMIQKGMNPSEESPPKTGGKSLFIGLALVAIGIAFLIIALVNDQNMLTPSLLHLFVGGAMLGYWKITEVDRKLASRLYEEKLKNFAEITLNNKN